MRNDRIRYIKEHCFEFYKNNIQKQYKRNGDLTYRENYSNKSTTVISSELLDEHGTWELNTSDGDLDYTTVNGTGLDLQLDLYTLIRIDTDDDLNLYASIPYNVTDNISFEIDNRGLFIINEN